MTQTIEKVARALFAFESGRELGASERAWPTKTDGVQAEYRNEARAVIEAVAANVTDEMVKASFRIGTGADWIESRRAAISAAIRAALEE